MVVGRIGGLHGVRGGVKVVSYTEPREQLLQLSPWHLRRPDGVEASLTVVSGSAEGKRLVARLKGVADRDDARAWLGADVAVHRRQLPAAEAGRYYWVDLIGLSVVNREGIALGTVIALMETGANDVLVVQGERERLIPFVLGRVVLDVDLEAGVIEVDWLPDD